MASRNCELPAPGSSPMTQVNQVNLLPATNIVSKWATQPHPEFRSHLKASRVSATGMRTKTNLIENTLSENQLLLGKPGAAFFSLPFITSCLTRVVDQGARCKLLSRAGQCGLCLGPVAGWVGGGRSCFGLVALAPPPGAPGWEG